MQKDLHNSKTAQSEWKKMISIKRETRGFWISFGHFICGPLQGFLTRILDPPINMADFARFFRFVRVPVRRVSLREGDRLLHHPDLHPVYAHSDGVLGVVLARPAVCPRQGQPRGADSPHYADSEWSDSH